MTTSHNVRQMLSDGARLTTEDVAKLLRATADNEGNFHPGVLRLVQEFDALRWEIAGWQGRCEAARGERDELQRQLYAVRAALPRAGGPV